MYQTLLNRARNARQGDGGFTLIELLIVITVLGILAGIVVFGVSTFRDDADTAADATNCKMVSTAAEAFNARTGSYPTTVGQLLPTATAAGYLKDLPGGMDATTGITDGVADVC